MDKYTLITVFSDGSFKRSRFMSKKTCENVKQPGQIMLSKSEAIVKGFYVESNPRLPVKTYMPIQFIKGLTGNTLTPQRMFKENTERYETVCEQNGWIIPIG